MKKEELSNLQVFDCMVKEGNNGIALATTIVDSYTTKQGGVIGFGVEKKFSDDASFQREFGFPGTYMLFCFAVDRKEFESTKIKLQPETQKRYLVRNTYDTAIKNKLDEKLRAEFRKHLHKIVTGLDIPKFKILHAQIQNEYLSAGGRCKPFEYRDSIEHFTPTSHRTNFMIYLTDGYWIELIEVNETPFD